MQFDYLNNLNWASITREERVFCFELYNCMREDPFPFLKLLRKEALEGIEVGIEVCFYRDLLFSYNRIRKNSGYPNKRTFDLVIFAQTELIIFEAKSFNGFSGDQLNSIKEDRTKLEELFRSNKIKCPPKIEFWAITSDKYSPRRSTKNNFENIIHWSAIQDIYNEKWLVFKRANEIYGTKIEM